MGSIGRSLISGACACGVAILTAHAALGSGPPLGSTAMTTAGPPAESQYFFGPLRVRDLTPFGYLRLDMRPTFAHELAPGTWAFETEIAYQNTWALSQPVRRYLSRLPGRRTLGAVELADIRALPGENFLVDLELTQLDFTLHRQFNDDWGGFFIASAAAYGAGFLDGTIEQFHSTFAMSDVGRPAVGRGQINIIFDLRSLQYAELNARSRSGMLDPTIGVRYSGVQLPEPWMLALEGAAKIPLAGKRAWLSSGHLDAGLQATIMRRGTRHMLYASLSAVHHAGSSGPLQSAEGAVPTLVLALDSHLTRRTHSIVQLYASPSLYDEADTASDELRATKYQLSVGLRHQRARHVFSFAVTENLGYMNNTPDVGMQLGWVYRPAP
jgi:hypothetical protein